jgi:hypothetical protein
VKTFLFVLLIALVFATPALAQDCQPEPEWQMKTIEIAFGVEQRGEIVDVLYDKPYYSLMVHSAQINQPWPMEITRQDESGFTARITRPVEYKNKQTIYMDYFAFGYVVPDNCQQSESAPAVYRIMLPLVIQ